MKAVRDLSIPLPPESRCLILKLSAIGDCVLATPVAGELRRVFPQAHIAWVVHERCREVVEGNQHLDEVLVWREGPAIPSLLKVAREVRQSRFDVVLDLQGIMKSTALMWLSKIPVRMTSERSRTFARRVATRLIAEPMGDLHPLERYLHRARALSQCSVNDRSADSAYGARMLMPVTEADRVFARAFLREAELTSQDTIIGVNPGASRPSKLWEAAKFASVIDQVTRQLNAKVIVFGGPGDAEQCRKVLFRSGAGPVSAVGKTTLKQFAALAERCRVIVTGDTGPMHIASAMGTPVVTIFRPEERKRIPPYGRKHIVLPRDHATREVSVSEVLGAIQEQLNVPSPSLFSK